MSDKGDPMRLTKGKLFAAFVLLFPFTSAGPGRVEGAVKTSVSFGVTGTVISDGVPIDGGTGDSQEGAGSNVSVGDTIRLQARFGVAIASGGASADVGHLHVDTSCQARGRTGVGFSDIGSAGATATASWSDTALLQDFSRRPDVLLAVHGTLLTQGLLRATAEPNTQAEVQVEFSNGATYRAVEKPSLGIHIQEEPPLTLPVDLIVGNGQPFAIGSSMTVFAGAAAGDGLASADGDFFKSLHWGGIQSVTDAATGELLQDWTITSESGVDYSQPIGVPEPSGAILGLAGACGMSVRRRRRLHRFRREPLGT
jgi:hypothetical protein